MSPRSERLDGQKIPVRDYLLRRIARMKNCRDHHKPYRKTILFESVFSEAGITIDDRFQRKRYVDFCKLCLENWKYKNHISDYAFTKERNSFTGIAIEI